MEEKNYIINAYILGKSTILHIVKKKNRSIKIVYCVNTVKFFKVPTNPVLLYTRNMTVNREKNIYRNALYTKLQ